MSADIQARLQEVLVREMGVGDVTPEGEHALSFRWFGFEYLSNCQSSKWLHIGIALQAAAPEVRLVNVLELSHVPPHEMTPRLAYLNSVFTNLRFTLGNESSLRIEWTGFVFGSLVGPNAPDPDPLPEGFEARSLDTEEVAGICEVAMGQLMPGIVHAFQIFGQVPMRQPRTFPIADGRAYPDSFDLFRQVVARSGLPWVETMAPYPTLYFFDGSGAAFTLVAAERSIGGYVLRMEFYEARIYDLNASPGNVIDGQITQDLLDLLADVASGLLGMKAYGSVEKGSAVLSTNGVLTTSDPNVIEGLLPFLTGTLAGFAEMAFGEANVAILTHERERARRTA